MTLRLANTLTGETEPFTVDGDSVLLYYCGLTVSDPPHLGHARSWVTTDVLHRWLDHEGYDVRHVENFTDVNEKIVARIGADGEDETAVARHYIERAIADMRSLNLLRADVYPRVSEHVDEIVALVERLIDAGYAYEADGSVYFDVAAFDGYGSLSNQQVDDMESQGDPDERAEKRHPADFALWRGGGVDPEDVAEHRREGAASPATAAERALTWDSPWGEGRPGWHIECSAMSMGHLGESIDVHVGGRDLVFPHHENEIAQSEAATGERFVRYWLHVGLVETGEEKMSSSLRNFATVEQQVAAHGPDAVRLFLLSRTYDTPLTYSEAAIEEAVSRWEQLERAHDRATTAIDGPDARTTVTDGTLAAAVDAAREAFVTAMNDDLNTREAIAALQGLANAVDDHLAGRDTYDYRSLRRAVETIEEFGGDVLGFDLDGTGGGRVRLAESLVDLVLDLREREREAGEYERADALRDDLEALGIEVEDTDDGPTYRLP
ncbi:cysteine--tRNA ligase [Halobacteriales archaeon SW_7_68_16]|nr:MAG: cysteine--tRNA ligase [Halobacteriales archaeon SW_7_68_16]